MLAYPPVIEMKNVFSVTHTYKAMWQIEGVISIDYPRYFAQCVIAWGLCFGLLGPSRTKS